MTRTIYRSALFFCLVLAVGCKKSAPVNVAATVNDRVITFSELEKNFKSQLTGGTEGASEDQLMIQKMELLRNLIDNQIMLQRAEKMGLMAVDSEVEGRFNEMRAPYTKEEFERLLHNRSMTAEDLKTQIRQDLSIQKVFNKEITSRINISDADVATFYNTNKAKFNFAEPQVRIAQILVTASPDPNVHNLKNDKARNPDEARKKIEAIEGRLKAGEDFAMLAQNYSEDPNTAQSGGDLGFVPESGLEKVNVQIRGMISTLKAGQISPILPAPDGYRILKLISKEPSGQRELSDPRVQQTIREILRNRKDQLLKTAYYEMARNDANVVNYLARSIIEGTEKPAK
ncbi:MAG: peptidylprolyl isomerase [Acidobacteria bacterium]|nr:MAG: peptidylprolyl isomerase [Acidobacteriota bacterium]